MDQIFKKVSSDGQDTHLLRQQTSMGTLIVWNISKAIEMNPGIDLKSAIVATRERLQHGSRDAALASSPEQEHLACALLAWQQLGHSEADSLYQFVETKQNQAKPCPEDRCLSRKPELCPGSFISYEDSSFSKGVGSSTFDTYSLMGPVVKLPVDTKIVMRMDTNPCERHNAKKAPEKDLMTKVDAACCMESACLEKLTQLDTATNELKLRAQRLARREAERAELLERAETAWKDLELGYQRRLAMAEEREEDIAKHIKKLIEERNGYKNACTTLALQLRQRGEVAEKERALLTEVEKEVCENACLRLRLSEESARMDAALAEQQCKAAQLDRDLKFKEEQIRRKLQTMESEFESTRCLTHEAERALHAELNALRQQVASVSNQLLAEDAENRQIKEELELLRQEKLDMVEDLDGCKVVCDGRIQHKMDELKKKRQLFNELKERVMECQCKMPVDASVEVKRTPSLAALCKCSPEDKFLNKPSLGFSRSSSYYVPFEAYLQKVIQPYHIWTSPNLDACSCTSLRTTLLTNLLADLFSGLQTELGGSVTQMPCQLLKCLEDRHNWDKSSIVKTNLRDYFSHLLVGELDIAIATSIEKYHAKWVGASCADAARMIPDCGGPETEGWQERALEMRAQKLAAKLAEQLFQDRADQLTAKAREIITSGPPPCDCRPQPAAVYPVLVKQPVISSAAPASPKSASAATPAYWRRTHQDVTQLRVQLEDLKKDSIKKQDLKVMEENIVKLVQRATVTENTKVELGKESSFGKGNSIHTSSNIDAVCRHSAGAKLSSIKKKQSDLSQKKVNKNLILGLPIEKPVRSFKRVRQTFAVNLCLCGSQKTPRNSSKAEKIVTDILCDDDKIKSKDVPHTKSDIKPAKHEIKSSRRNKTRPSCQSNVTCFHKPPPSTSIDKLLETLAKWNCDLTQLDSKGLTKENNNTCTAKVDKEKESDQKIYKNIPMKVSKNLSAVPYRPQVIVANVSESMPVQGGMPMNTESEYMGAINLDSGSGNNQEPPDIPKSPKLAKCVNSAACTCTESEIRNRSHVSKVEQSINNKQFNVDSVGNTNQVSENKKGDVVQSRSQKDNKTKSNEGHLMDTITDQSDSQYLIKFLGVTLTNANSNKVKKGKALKNDKKNIDDRSMKEKSDKLEVKYNKLDDLHLPVNSATKQQGDFNKNEDKYLDTQSLQKPLSQESCICCNGKQEESKELEVNTFHLLEEHLRQKFEEFKISTCKSSCISPEEAERLFATILQRVKQIITDSTGGMACKCTSEELTEGSWNRAYMLLEEYLKIKIKRVQCLCLSTEDTNEVALPNVLEKVCTLIDNDFLRLEKFCKCKEDNKNNLQFEIELPEKDVSNHQYNEETSTLGLVTETKKVSKQISNNSIIRAQNISSQVTPNYDMDTKSCDVMEACTQNVQTNHINKNKSCKISKFNYDYCYCAHSPKITKSNLESFGTEQVIVNQCLNIHKEKESFNPPDTSVKENHNSNFNEIDSLRSWNDPINIENEPKKNVQKITPYIGYTVECSCDEALGTCTCTKSMITGKNDNINSIWNTLTSNKLRNGDISYIMNAVGNKTNTENIKGPDNADTNYVQLVSKTTCDTTISAQNSEEMVLKDSKAKFNKIFLSATTSGEDVVSFGQDFNSEPIEWCECSSSIKRKSQNLNDFSDKTRGGALYYPTKNVVNRGRSECLVKSDQMNMPSSISSNCDCNLVPMCHVKMLVKNIESKLMHSKCTCDSLCSKICPVHGNKN